MTSTALSTLLLQVDEVKFMMSSMQIEMKNCVGKLDEMTGSVRELIQSQTETKKTEENRNYNPRDEVVTSSKCPSDTYNIRDKVSIDFVTSKARLKNRIKNIPEENMEINTKTFDDRSKCERFDALIEVVQNESVNSPNEFEKSNNVFKESDSFMNSISTGIVMDKKIYLDVSKKNGNPIAPCNKKVPAKLTGSHKKVTKSLNISKKQFLFLFGLKQKVIKTINDAFDVKVHSQGNNTDIKLVEVFGVEGFVDRAVEVIRKIVTPEVNDLKNSKTLLVLEGPNSSRILMKAQRYCEPVSLLISKNIRLLTETSIFLMRNNTIVVVMGEESNVENALEKLDKAVMYIEF